jgi:hypothetical protein
VSSCATDGLFFYTRVNDVGTQYCNELKFEFQNAHETQTRSLNELRYGTDEKIKKVAIITHRVLRAKTREKGVV